MKLKTILKVVVYLIVGLLIAAIILPFVFKDQIIQEVKDLANENLNATLNFEDIDLSLLSSFPKLNLKIKDLTLIGIDEFEMDTLISSKSIEFDMNITPLFNKDVKPEISYIGLNEPKINIKVLSSGKANYDITKPSEDTTSTGFEVPLNKYEINDGNISYRDYSSNMFITVKDINHSGKGNFTESVFDLDTETRIEKLTAELDGTTYLYKIPAELSAIFQINLPEQKYTLKDNQLNLRNFKLNGDGFIQLNNDDILIDLSLTSPSNKFGDLFTVFPFIPMQAGMDIQGNYAFDSKIKGVYNGVKSQYPQFDLAMSIDGGSVQYPDLPYPIKQMNAKVKIASTKPDLSDLVINIPAFNFKLNNEETKGRLNINKSLSDPKIEGEIQSNLTLENWTKAIPMEGIEQLSGKLQANLTFDGKMSDVDSKAYQNLVFTGSLKGQDVLYKSSSNPTISSKSFDLKASPQMVDISTNETYLGKSKMNIKGNVKDPLAFLSDKINVSGSIDIEADKLDLNEWSSQTPSSENTAIESDADLSYLDQLVSSDIAINFKANEIKYDVYKLQNTNVKGNLGRNIIKIDDFSSKIGDSDLKMSGIIENALDYFLGTAVLKGKLNLSSQYFNANEFMSEEEDTEEITNFDVPMNIDLEINTDVKKLTYTNIDLKNFKGNMAINNQAISLQGVESEVLSGKINLEGLYDSKEESPTFDTKIDLSKIKFSEAYQNFLTIKALAPIAKYIDGFFNTTLVFSGKMNEGMVPDFGSLNASGFIETLNSTIKNAAPLQAVATQLNISKLSNLDLKDTKNWFEIKNGTVELKENDFEFYEIQSKVKGSHKIEGEMNYELLMNIPRELLKSNTATQAIDKGLSFLESKAKSVGINIDQGEYIDIKVGLTGTLLKPKVKITPLGSSGKSVQDEVKGEVNKAVEQAKDSIQKEVKKQTDKVVDTLKKTAEKEIDKAKNKAVDEAEKIVDKTKDKVKQKVEEVIDSNVSKVVTDTLANKVKDAIEKSTGKEVDDIKDKIKDWNPFKKKKGN